VQRASEEAEKVVGTFGGRHGGSIQRKTSIGLSNCSFVEPELRVHSA
jgi:hypothetical protein